MRVVILPKIKWHQSVQKTILRVNKKLHDKALVKRNTGSIVMSNIIKISIDIYPFKIEKK